MKKNIYLTLRIRLKNGEEIIVSKQQLKKKILHLLSLIGNTFFKQ